MKKCDSSVKSLSDSVGILSGQSESCNETSSSPFNHPVYKQLSQINGQINKMSRDQLISKLEQFHLGIQGTNEILKKRLKTFYKEQKLMQAQILKSEECECPYKYLCVIDFEATCDEDAEYMHEIIEFPAVLVDTKEKKVISTFHEYCHPTLNPLLTDFCKLLTKISQETVDYAETFTVVLHNFTKWLYHHCPNFEDVAVVTDGSYDMGLFLIKQCEISSIPIPEFCKKWINVRKLYSNFYKTTRCNLETMLKILGMTFEGQHHCGRDDALNISKIVIQMLQDGAKFVPNEQLLCQSLPSKTSNSGCYVGSGPIVGSQRKISSNNSSELETTKSIQVNDKPLDENSYKSSDKVESVTVNESTKTEEQSNNNILVTEKSEMYNKTESVEKIIEANTNEKESMGENKCVESVTTDSLKKSKGIENKLQTLTSELQNASIDANKLNNETCAKSDHRESDQALLELFFCKKNLVLESSKRNLGNSIDNEVVSIANPNEEKFEGKDCKSEICTRQQLSENTKAENSEKSKLIFTKEHKEKSIPVLREDLHCLGDKLETVEKELKDTQQSKEYVANLNMFP